MLTKEDKKAIRELKSIVFWCNVKIGLWFIYGIVSLFAYPFALGYWLNTYSKYLGALGFVCFVVQFILLSNDNNTINAKIENVSKDKETAIFYIINYEALKNGSPTVHDPKFYK